MAAIQPPKLIASLVKALQELEAGIRSSNTALQLHFVEVCKGAAEPRTAYERAYRQWRAEVQRHGNKTQKSGRARDVSGAFAATIRPRPLPRRRPAAGPIPNHMRCFAFEPVGAREDSKRDSGANFANSRRNRL
jgi:uncharacterized protein YifE (UPF0438 family)